MKRNFYSLFCTLTVLLLFSSLTAQNKLLSHEQRNATVAPQEMRTGAEEAPVLFSSQAKRTLPVRTRSTTEVNIGTTVYDLQTNAAICNRFTRMPDGSMYGTWTIGFEDTAYPDRGTGYNAFDGNDWGSAPSARLEADARTGWPNFVRTADGTEFIVNHVFDAGAYRLHYLRREAGATEWTEGDLPTGTPFGSLWPRAAGGGSDGNSIHVISITTTEVLGGVPYEGVNAHIIYHRSTDAGATWDITDGIIPGLDSTLMRDIVRADGYSIDANGDALAVGLFSPFNDVRVFKSTDNGESWGNWRINDFPIDQYQIDQGYSVDDLPPYDSTISPNPIAIFTTDGAGTVLLDNDDMAHVFYGEMFVQDTAADAGGWFFFPCISGIAYWNENYGEDSIRTITSVLDLNGNDVLDIDCTSFDFGRYGIAGLTSFPSAGIDANNNLFLAYQMVAEGDEFFNDLDNQHYAHIMLMASLDGGETWTEPYDIVNDDILIEPDLANFTETAFPHVAKRVDDKMHFIYQQDFRPGLSAIGDGDDPSDNFINYVGVGVEQFGLVAAEEPLTGTALTMQLFPNPATDMVRLYYNLPEHTKTAITLSDITGKTVRELEDVTGFEGLNVATARVADLASGIYLVRLENNTGSVIRKLVIQ